MVMRSGTLTSRLNKRLAEEREHREYIGSSLIGGTCERAIWYAYNGFGGEPFSAKQLRTFAIGKALEVSVVNWLRDSGLTVHTGLEQMQDKLLPLFRGTMDGILQHGDCAYVLEIKTANDSSFKQFVKKGLRLWSPQYWAQLQSYMGMSGLQHAVLVCVNKDTSDIHDEVVGFDEMAYEGLRAKADWILSRQEPPKRVNESPLFIACRMCRFKGVCRGF